MYNRKAHERDPLDLEWADTELKTEIQRVIVKPEISFLKNMFVSWQIHFIALYVCQ